MVLLSPAGIAIVGGLVTGFLLRSRVLFTQLTIVYRDDQTWDVPDVDEPISPQNTVLMRTGSRVKSFKNTPI